MCALDVGSVEVLEAKTFFVPLSFFPLFSVMREAKSGRRPFSSVCTSISKMLSLMCKMTTARRAKSQVVRKRVGSWLKEKAASLLVVCADAQRCNAAEHHTGFSTKCQSSLCSPLPTVATLVVSFTTHVVCLAVALIQVSFLLLFFCDESRYTRLETAVLRYSDSVLAFDVP